MRQKNFHHFIALILITIIGIVNFSYSVEAKNGNPNWQPVTVLGGERIPAMWPTVIIDSYKRVHAFWTQPLDDHDAETFAIMQTIKTDQNWSMPNDIILRDNWPYSHPHVVIADKNMIIVWSEWTGLYFSTAPVIGGENAKNWQPKRQISPHTGIDQNWMVVDHKGTIYVVYSRLGTDLWGDGNIYYLSSVDGGKNWSAPEKVTDTRNGKNNIYTAPRISVDNQNIVHIVFSENLNTTFWRERAVFYKNLDETGKWSETAEISEPNPDKTLWEASPSIAIDNENTVHVVWTCGKNTNRCYRYSLNHGKTWSEIQNILPKYESLAGWDSMVAAPNGDLHLIAQLRYPENIYYTVKPLRGNWETPEPISDYIASRVAHYPEIATDGDRISAVMQPDSAGPIFYMEGWLNHGEQGTTALVEPTKNNPIVQNNPTSKPNVAPVKILSPTIQFERLDDPLSNNFALFIGVIAPVVVFLVALVIRDSNRSKM